MTVATAATTTAVALLHRMSRTTGGIVVVMDVMHLVGNMMDE
jgi:hypothetical protein